MNDTDRTEPVRLLFVCLGNICRSPTAEAVMAAHVDAAGLARWIVVDSAGTGDWHVGDPPDERASAEAMRRGIAMRSRARQIQVDDFETFDLVLAMDSYNLTDLRTIAPHESARTKVHLLRSFDPASGADAGAASDPDHLDVPDPYFGGVDGFARVFDLIDAACIGLLEHLRCTHLASDLDDGAAGRGDAPDPPSFR